MRTSNHDGCLQLPKYLDSYLNLIIKPPQTSQEKIDLEGSIYLIFYHLKNRESIGPIHGWGYEQISSLEKIANFVRPDNYVTINQNPQSTSASEDVVSGPGPSLVTVEKSNLQSDPSVCNLGADNYPIKFNPIITAKDSEALSAFKFFGESRQNTTTETRPILPPPATDNEEFPHSLSQTQSDTGATPALPGESHPQPQLNEAANNDTDYDSDLGDKELIRMSLPYLIKKTLKENSPIHPSSILYQMRSQLICEALGYPGCELTSLLDPNSDFGSRFKEIEVAFSVYMRSKLCDEIKELEKRVQLEDLKTVLDQIKTQTEAQPNNPEALSTVLAQISRTLEWVGNALASVGPKNVAEFTTLPSILHPSKPSSNTSGQTSTQGANYNEVNKRLQAFPLFKCVLLSCYCWGALNFPESS